MSRQAPLFGVASWPADVRHALLLGASTAVTFVVSEVVPQLDGWQLLLVHGACLIIGAILTPLVQGYGLGQGMVRASTATTVRGKVLPDREDVP